MARRGFGAGAGAGVLELLVRFIVAVPPRVEVFIVPSAGLTEEAMVMLAG